jgi:hypothetical protein
MEIVDWLDSCERRPAMLTRTPRRQLSAAIVMFLTVCCAACDKEKASPVSEGDQGNGQCWLAVRGQEQSVPNSGILEVDGSLQSVFGAVEQPPDGARVVFGLGHSARGFVVRTDSGVDWYVGYSVEIAGGRDATPDLGRHA